MDDRGVLCTQIWTLLQLICWLDLVVVHVGMERSIIIASIALGAVVTATAATIGDSFQEEGRYQGCERCLGQQGLGGWLGLVVRVIALRVNRILRYHLRLPGCCYSLGFEDIPLIVQELLYQFDLP